MHFEGKRRWVAFTIGSAWSMHARTVPLQRGLGSRLYDSLSLENVEIHRNAEYSSKKSTG
jgi:hypothetical protein